VILPLLLAAGLAASPAQQADRDTTLKAASAAMAAGRKDEARKLLSDAGTRFGSVRALLQLARLQSTDGDAAGALETLRAARRLAPNSEDVLSALAAVSLAAKAPLAAILTLQSLTRLCPSAAQYHYLLGIALVRAGDMPAAADALARADALDPDRALTLVALGLVYTQEKRYDEAKPALARSLELDPDNVEALAALAEAESGLNDIAAAERDASRALKADARNARANLVMGMVRMTQERYRDALDALLVASAADPRSPKVDYQLSLVYSRLGDQSAAKHHLDVYQQKLRAMEAELKALHDAGVGGGVRR
jgi:tetratricopeptide (TPR) repeat protein